MVARWWVVVPVLYGVQSSSPRVHIHRLLGALSRRPGPVPFSADDRELAEFRLRYDSANPRDCRRDCRRLSSACIAVVAVEFAVALLDV